MTFALFRHTLAAWHAIAGSATYAAAAHRSRSPVHPAPPGRDRDHAVAPGRALRPWVLRPWVLPRPAAASPRPRARRSRADCRRRTRDHRGGRGGGTAGLPADQREIRAGVPPGPGLPRRMRPEPPGNAGPATEAGPAARYPGPHQVRRTRRRSQHRAGQAGNRPAGTQPCRPAPGRTTGTREPDGQTAGDTCSRTGAAPADGQGTGAGLARPYGPDRAAIRPAPGHAREAAAHAAAPAARRAGRGGRGQTALV